MKNLTAAGIAVLNENNQNVTGSVLFSAFTRSADGKQYTFTINLGANAPAFTMGKFTILVIDGAAVSDDADELPCGFSQSAIFTIDRIPPAATLIPWPSQFTDGGKTNLATIDYKAIFELPVSNLPRNFIILNAGAGIVTSVFAIPNTNLKEWHITVTPTLTGTTIRPLTARLATGIYSDPAGNSNTPSNTVVVDIKRNLAITSTLTPGVNVNSLNSFNYSVGKLSDLAVRFGDTVDPTTITAAAFKVAGGTVTNIRPDLDNKGAKFDLVFANLPSTRFNLSVAMQAGVVRDTYGNAALASTPLAWVIDGQSPLATMSGAARIRLGETASVAIAFTENVQPLTLSMFDVTFTPLGGAPVAVTTGLTIRGSAASWSISYKPGVRGTLTVRLNIDAAGPKDLVGNVVQIPAGFQVVIA
jgi:hypothetical protein